MIDAADRDKIEASRNELHNLLDKPQLQGIPVSMEYIYNFRIIIVTKDPQRSFPRASVVTDLEESQVLT